MSKNFGLATKLLHTDLDIDTASKASAVPIYMTAAYNFRDSEYAENLFKLNEKGHIYSRISNPTNEVFEKRMAALEGGIGALSFASGHAAVLGTIWNLTLAGDEILSSGDLYGGTFNIFAHALPKQGINVNFVRGNNPEDYTRAITEKTKAIFAETIGNPRASVADIETLAKIAHENGIPLIIDATFSPYINRAIDFGADIIIHSATKFIGGHGTSMGGVVVDAGNFDYANGKFPVLSEPDPCYHGLRYTDLETGAFITRLRSQIMRDWGACLSPFNAFMFLQGLETLHVRMERHIENALKTAEYLENHPKVSWVSYPGLKSHPDYELAKKYFPKGAGSIFSFGLHDGREGSKRFIDNVQLFSHLANVGDVKSLVIHPATSTHSQLSKEQQELSGVSDDLIRLSVGIEDISDILQDLEYALDKV